MVLEDIFNILSKQLYNKNFEKEFLNGPKAITGLRFKMKKKIYLRQKSQQIKKIFKDNKRN